jgi:hypothetical protein
MITNTVVFAFIFGALTGLVVAGARAWTISLGLKMTWWKWLLAAVWYALLVVFVFMDFTIIGEGEPAAGLKMLLFQGVIMIILSVGLGRLLWSGRAKK